jgi:hypothetical protein
MQLRASSLAFVISPFSTLKAALLQLGATRRGADETILTALGLPLPWDRFLGQSEFDLERYDVFSDMRKPQCEVASCAEMLSASIQLESILSVGEQIVGVNEDQLLADLVEEQNAVANATVASPGPGVGRRRQQSPADGDDQGVTELLKDNRADEIVFALSHVLAEKMQRAVAYAETVVLGDAELVLSLLREAKVVTMVDTSPVIVETIAATLSALNTYTHTTLAAAASASNAEGGVGGNVEDRMGMLRTANTVGLLVQEALISQAHEMLLVAADGQPEDLLALAENVATEFDTEEAISAQVIEIAHMVGAIPQYEPPPEPEPEPEPGPEPEPEPQPEPEPPEPEPETVEEQTEQQIGNELSSSRLGLLAVLVLVGTSCVVVTAGVLILLMWRKKIKSQRATTPERVYVEKTCDVPAMPEKRKRHRRADKDTTIKAVAPKNISELATLGMQVASGAFVRPTTGKTKADKKETEQQRRKRERRELIAATRTQAGGRDQSTDPSSNAGIRLNRRERQQARMAKQGSAGGRSGPSRRSPDQGHGSAGRHSPSRKSPDRGRGRGREGQHSRARRSP